MNESIKTEVYRSQVLDRTFQIFDILSQGDGGHGVTELAEKLKLHKSTAHRLIMVLESSRYVERDGATGKYRLGSRILELGLSALSKLDVYDVARPHLRALVTETGETAHIGVLRDGEVVSIVNVESTQAIRTPSTVGTRHPAHCSSLGKVILAFSPTQEVNEFLSGRTLEGFTPNTITTAELFLKEIDRVRESGYAVDDEEREMGLRCIGAPVRSSSGETIASVSIAGPVFRITEERMGEVARAVVRAADTISAALGYRGKAFPDVRS